MVPIEPILEDIKRQLKTSDVRLPKAWEIESLALLPSVSNTKTIDGLTHDGEIRSPALVQSKVPTPSKPEKPSKFKHYSTSRSVLKPPREMVNYRLELPGVSDSHYKKNRLPKQQEGDTINEKSTILEHGPKSLEAARPHRSPHQGDLLGNTDGEIKAKTSSPRRIPESLIPENESAQQVLEEHRSTEYYPPPYLPPQRGSGSYKPNSISSELAKLKPHRSPSGNLFSTVVRKTVVAPYLLWRRLETLILRTEFRRRKRWSRSKLLPFRIGPHRPSSHATDLRSAFYKDIKIILYCLFLPFSISGTLLLNLLYFVGCFPLILLISSRHRDVLDDEETLRRQRNESIEMLGSLFDTHDYHRMEERAAQRHREHSQNPQAMLV